MDVLPQNQIVVSGAREHNLKDVTLAMPRDSLVVITGLSGSGRVVVGFDTIYAEGQRRYVESLSAYAGSSLARWTSRTSIDRRLVAGDRSTGDDVLTAVDRRHGHRDYDYCAAVGAHRPSALPHLRQADRRAVDRADHRPRDGKGRARASWSRRSCAARGRDRKVIEELRAEGFPRAKVDGELQMLDEDIVLDKKFKHDISVVVDRLVMRGESASAWPTPSRRRSRWPTA